MASTINIQKLEIEIDSQDLFNLLNIADSDNHPLVMLLNHCKLLLSKFENIRITKIKRIQNICADKMAKAARKSRSNLRTFAGPPPFVQRFYMGDLSHV